mmetsp:Transcript_31204/g.70886  ORF Transcript_31204/g.70886 Transcript_31204/m.70886 type:complete len:228 (-) Transcript_31204:18-701(-)
MLSAVTSCCSRVLFQLSGSERSRNTSWGCSLSRMHWCFSMIPSRSDCAADSLLACRITKPIRWGDTSGTEAWACDCRRRLVAFPGVADATGEAGATGAAGATGLAGATGAVTVAAGTAGGAGGSAAGDGISFEEFLKSSSSIPLKWSVKSVTLISISPPTTNPKVSILNTLRSSLWMVRWCRRLRARVSQQTRTVKRTVLPKLSMLNLGVWGRCHAPSAGTRFRLWR